MRPGTRKALRGCAAALALGFALVLGLVGWFYVVQPRILIDRFDATMAAHPVGSALDGLLDDPFVARADEVQVRGAQEERTAGYEKLTIARAHARVAAVGAGHLTVEWVVIPPFGRLYLEVNFEKGAITSLKKFSLD